MMKLMMCSCRQTGRYINLRMCPLIGTCKTHEHKWKRKEKSCQCLDELSFSSVMQVSKMKSDCKTPACCWPQCRNSDLNFAFICWFFSDEAKVKVWTRAFLTISTMESDTHRRKERRVASECCRQAAAAACVHRGHTRAPLPADVFAG